jgi:hypothetical protein
MERRISEAFPIVFALRPDGVAREIMGVDQQLLVQASTRRLQVMERAGILVADYRAREGREPGPAAMKAINQAAALQTRASKAKTPPLDQILLWADCRAGQLRSMIDSTVEWYHQVARLGHPDQRNQRQLPREQLLASAVMNAQSQYSTWTLGNLMEHVSLIQAVNPALSGGVAELTWEALREGHSYGVVGVSAPDPAPVPVELQRPDGKSKYRAHNDDRFTTAEQLSIENGIVASARARAAPAVRGAELELARIELIARGLSEDQLRAALGVLGSGRCGDALIGAAGVGKSRTVAGLGVAWETYIGGRVIALATSQKATDVLATENGMTALNTTQFLIRYAPDHDERVPAQVRPGDLFVLDEAGMAGTEEWRRISRIVAAGGGKMLYTGDPAQLSSHGAGGMLDLLVRDNGAFELDQVHRFAHDWEKSASVGLRAGDVSVLDAYHAEGRLVGGTAEEAAEAAARGYLADILAGKASFVVVNTNSQAAEMSARIRAELVRLERVGREILETLRDATVVGVGDLIQARRNAPEIRVEGDGMVTNRETYTVLGVEKATGALKVQAVSGAIAYLPAAYVREHVTLAYGATVHAVQGATVDTCHALIDEQSALRSVYVAMTRGREANYAYLTTQQDPDQHEVVRLDATPVETLSRIIARDRAETESATVEVTAELTRRVGEESGASLASVGTQWDLLTSEYGKAGYIRSLNALMGPRPAEIVVAERGFLQLVHAVRAAELAGHDPHAVLHEAVTQRGLDDAASVSDVLRWRINRDRDQRTPERDVRPGDWANLIQPIDGPEGDYARALADAATQRQAQLGARAWAQPPPWALHYLGPAPSEPRQAQEWTHRAGVIAAYRDIANVADASVSFGAIPAEEQVFHRALWQQAFVAAGCPKEDLDYLRATDDELRAMRRAWTRMEGWAPYFVLDEVARARHHAVAHLRDAQLWTVEAQLYPPGSPERHQAVLDIQAAEQAAAYNEARAGHLEVIHEARVDWAAAAEPARLIAVKAREELARRGHARRRPDQEVDQLPLFEVHTIEEPTRGDIRKAAAAGLTPVDSGGDMQAALFAAEPTPADLAAALPLREVADHDQEFGENFGPVTLGEARRQAEISTALRSCRVSGAVEATGWDMDCDAYETGTRLIRVWQEHDDDLGQSLSGRRDSPRQSMSESR